MNTPLIFLGLLMFFGQILSFAAEGRPALITTNLAAPVSATDTTVTVTDASGFPATGSITIQNEFMPYTSHNNTVFSGITRTIQDDGKPAQSYISGTQVLSEVAGLARMGIRFQNVDSDAGFLGTLQFISQLPGVFLKLMGKIVMWDFSYWNGDLMGIPLAYGQFILFFVSMGLIFTMAARLKNLVNPFSSS